MDKKSLTEADIRSKYITPAIVGLSTPKWDLQTQLREEVHFTAGRIMVRGKLVKRGKSKKADYILYYKPNIPLAIVEAKDNKHSIGDGMQQALDYADTLDIPFVYSSNGDAFLEHDRTQKEGPIEREIPLADFPSPEELFTRYCKAKGLEAPQQAITTHDYYTDASGKSPRYYQRIAINRTVNAIATGQNRILLVMATGTGKTYTAFQIIWRLWKSLTKKRILFLVDRNILADQTMINDFAPFGKAMTKITNRTIDKSYEIYLALYQAVTGTEEEMNIYKQFSPDFFDLILIDECHRGSAADDAAWRKVLEYFSSATQIGLTATPKETKDVSNIHYFGEPIYTYTLKQGIEDGFLAPYKVIRIGLDKDLDGWRPEQGKLDKYGNEIEDREYNLMDYDRNIVLEKRTKRVAAKITEFLKANDRYAKTIVFCENIEHAEHMRQALANANPDLVAESSKYVMRITGDNEIGKAQLDHFIDPESTYPVIATTSMLMTTGVDAKTCKLIVLDKRIQSMTEFKQIIGRGTRLREDYDKYYFTIMDFRQATTNFSDPDFDGPPIQIYEPAEYDPIDPDAPDAPESPEDEDDIIDGGDWLPDDEESPDDHPDTSGDDGWFTPGGSDEEGGDSGGGGRTKYYVNDVEVTVATERVQYLDEHGKLITESLKDYTRKQLQQQYSTLDDFLTQWNSADQKKAILDELTEHGVFLEALEDQFGTDYDPFDLICHLAFDQPPLTRKERAEQVKKQHVFAKYGDQARAVLEALLDKYADTGISEIESMNVLKVDPLDNYGTPIEIIKLFGGKPGYLAALKTLEDSLYGKVA